MNTNSVNLWMSIGMFFAAILTSAIIATWRVAGIETRVGDSAQKTADDLRDRIELLIAAGNRELGAQISLIEQRDSKGRSDITNAFERALTDVRQNLRETDARHAVLDREAIRKADLSSVESRLVAAMVQTETRITTAVTQCEVRHSVDIEKLDRRLAEAVKLRPEAH